MSVNAVIVANFSLGVGVDRYHSNKHEFGNRGMTEEELAEFKCGIEMVATCTTCRNVKNCQHSVFLMAVTVSGDISLNSIKRLVFVMDVRCFCYAGLYFRRIRKIGKCDC